MNREIKLYELSKEEQDIISKYQSAKVGMVNKFNATWYKNKICKMFENVEITKGEYGDEYKYWLITTINDYTIEFKMNKDDVVIYLIYNPTRRKGLEALDYIAVNYNMQKLKEIKEQVLLDKIKELGNEN
jgi:hypothetical protein